MWGHGSWHPNFDTKPHFVGENGLSCELLVPFAAMLCTKPHFLADSSAYLNIRLVSLAESLRFLAYAPIVARKAPENSSQTNSP